MMVPLIAMPGGWELFVVLIVVVLIFGVGKFATSLPELARGTGQALRIFKSETKGLRDDDSKPADGATGATGDAAQQPGGAPAELPPVRTDAADQVRTEVPSERQDGAST